MKRASRRCLILLLMMITLLISLEAISVSATPGETPLAEAPPYDGKYTYFSWEQGETATADIDSGEMYVWTLCDIVAEEEESIWYARADLWKDVYVGEEIEAITIYYNYSAYGFLKASGLVAAAGVTLDILVEDPDGNEMYGIPLIDYYGDSFNWDLCYFKSIDYKNRTNYDEPNTISIPSPGSYRVRIQLTGRSVVRGLAIGTTELSVNMSIRVYPEYPPPPPPPPPKHVAFTVWDEETEDPLFAVVEAWNPQTGEFFTRFTERIPLPENMTFQYVDFWLEDGTYYFNFMDPYCGHYRKVLTRGVTSDMLEIVYLTPGFRNITINSGALYPLPYGAEAIYPSWTVTVNVTVENHNATTQNITVFVYAKGKKYGGISDNYKKCIGAQTVDLDPGERVLTITCNTIGLEPCAYNYTAGEYLPYKIVALAGDCSDRPCGVNVVVRLPGDANGDGHCAIGDLSLLGGAWGQYYPSSYYKWRADFNGDGKVYIGDLAILGGNWYRYSETPPPEGGDTKVYVSPSNSTAAVGDIFIVNITVSDVENLYTWSAGIEFNASVLQCLNFTEGPFLKEAGITISISGTIDNENGRVYPPYGYSLTGYNVTGVNGTGVLASVTFEVIGIGNSHLNLTDVELCNLTGDEPMTIPIEVVNGSFTVGHDVAVTNVTRTLPYGATAVYPGWKVQVNATVKNRGGFTETFNVTAYYRNETYTAPIGTQNVTNLPPGANITLTFNWTVPTIPKQYPYPNYTISANATVPDDVNPGNDEYIDGGVVVKWPGDANGDGHVNQTDLDILGAAYGKKYPDPLYDPRADFNGDGKVGIGDLAILSQNWGKGPLD